MIGRQDRPTTGFLKLFLVAGACLALAVFLTALSGCGNNNDAETQETQQSSPTESEATANPEKLADQLYADPKGYFRIAYPDGWEVQEYPDDSRGKVAFTCPDDSSVDLRVLVNVVDYSSVDRLLEELKEKESQLGVDTGIEQTTFDGRPAIKRSFDIQGSHVLMLDFLVGNVAHNLMYTAPSGDYDSYLPVVKKAMETYQPIGKAVGKTDAKQSAVAKCLRLAELMLESGNLGLASGYVDEGLKLSPKNQKLLELRKQIADRKSRQ